MYQMHFTILYVVDGCCVFIVCFGVNATQRLSISSPTVLVRLVLLFMHIFSWVLSFVIWLYLTAGACAAYSFDLCDWYSSLKLVMAEPNSNVDNLEFGLVTPPLHSPLFHLLGRYVDRKSKPEGDYADDHYYRVGTRYFHYISGLS